MKSVLLFRVPKRSIQAFLRDYELNWPLVEALQSVISSCMRVLDVFESNGATMGQMMTQFIKLINSSLKYCNDVTKFDKSDWTNKLNEKLVYILFEYTFGVQFGEQDGR